MTKSVVLLLVSLTQVWGCYWNQQCPYGLFGSKTPYNTVRGDIRDYASPANCEAISLWSIHRHGNRNPGSGTQEMKVIADLKDDIIASYYAGTSQLCAQDIEDFKKWTWNSTKETSQSELTGTGYEELYDIAKRIRERYPHLVMGSPEEFYFRTTDAQRAIASGMGFVHGLTDGLDLELPLDETRAGDELIRPYENCDRYQQEVKGGQVLEDHMNAYFSSSRYTNIIRSVQQRLGISTQLDADDIFSMYDLCRFYRSWAEDLRSPWCAPFTEEELLVLEYYEDLRHYYRNGYGSWVNINLGKIPMRDLYENFEAVVNGENRRMTSYFTHNAMMDMVYCALGLFDGDEPLTSGYINPSRVWRTSYMGAFSSNVIAVLNRCNESGRQTYRVQVFLSEKPTEVCPLEGCTWQQFQDKFQPFTTANLEFCNMNYKIEVDEATNNASPIRPFFSW